MKSDNPTTVERLAEVTSRMEIMTTDGDTSQLTQDDIGDIYSWLFWAQGKTSDAEELCECGQPKNSIRHSNAAASSVDAHGFRPTPHCPYCLKHWARGRSCSECGRPSPNMAIVHDAAHTAEVTKSGVDSRASKPETKG